MHQMKPGAKLVDAIAWFMFWMLHCAAHHWGQVPWSYHPLWQPVQKHGLQHEAPQWQGSHPCCSAGAPWSEARPIAERSARSACSPRLCYSFSPAAPQTSSRQQDKTVGHHGYPVLQEGGWGGLNTVRLKLTMMKMMAWEPFIRTRSRVVIALGQPAQLMAHRTLKTSRLWWSKLCSE